jgi:hypothetical protein
LLGSPAQWGLEAVQSNFFTPFAAKRAILRDSGRTTPVGLSLACWHCPADQLEQLVGKQGNAAKHKDEA